MDLWLLGRVQTSSSMQVLCHFACKDPPGVVPDPRSNREDVAARTGPPLSKKKVLDLDFISCN
jgi:hypothetical protein